MVPVMKQPVWLIGKPGEELCATTRAPSEDRVEALRGSGYRIIRADVDLPPEFDPADTIVKARVKRSG